MADTKGPANRDRNPSIMPWTNLNFRSLTNSYLVPKLVSLITEFLVRIFSSIPIQLLKIAVESDMINFKIKKTVNDITSLFFTIMIPTVISMITVKLENILMKVLTSNLNFFCLLRKSKILIIVWPLVNSILSINSGIVERTRLNMTKHHILF